MSFQKTLLAVSAITALTALTACGGGGSSSTTPTASTLSATLQDGLVVNATVFCDTNKNGQLDGGEMQTTTNSVGVFTFPTACTSDVVSVAGTGIDTDTGTAPTGSFRARAGSSVVSPFTTMSVEGSLTDAQARAVMAALGLGSVEPGATDLNSLSAAGKKKARAAIKILNDLSAVLTSTGTYPNAQAAFKAIAASFASHVSSNASGSFDLFSGNNLSNAIKAAVPASVPSDVEDLIAGSLNSMANSIATAADDDEAKRLFASSGATKFIDDHRDNPTAVVTYPGKDDLFAAAPRLEFSGVSLTSGDATQTLSATNVSAGTASTTFTLGNIDTVTIPVTAVNLANFPNHVAVAVEVTQDGSTRKLQFGIESVQLSINSGVVSATVPVGAELYFYAKTGGGVSIEPASALENLTANTYAGLSIPIGLIKEKVLAANSGNSAALNDALALTGKFNVKVTVSRVEVRPVGGVSAGVSTITVGTIDPQAFPGFTYSGAITFGAVPN